jgi:hypothetical protein
MRKKLQIFSLVNREVKYTKLQIESFKKHMNFPDVEFIIINGSIDHRDEVNQICGSEGIKTEQYFGDKNLPYLEYGLEHYRWFIENIVKKSSDYALLIHPDMFLIGEIKYKEILADKKIMFIPRYHVGLFYMWEGTILMDCDFLNISGLSNGLDIVGFAKGPQGQWSDGGGSSSRFLEKMNPQDYGFFEFWNLHDFDEDDFKTGLNGHASYNFNLRGRRIHHNESGLIGPALGDRTYEYENVEGNYEEYFIDNFVCIRDNFVSGYPFPRPIHIDIICKAGDLKNPFLIHFKSGSGYQDFFNFDYQEQKMNALREVIYNPIETK